jgi:hypothetical protein
MACRKFESLSTNDLDYVEQLLSKEFSKQCEYQSTFKSKNHYTGPNDTQVIGRVMDAIRSEKKYRQTTSEKW